MCRSRNEHPVTKILTAKARTVDDDAAAVEEHRGNGCTVDRQSGPWSNSVHAESRKRIPVDHKLPTSVQNEEKDEADSFLAVDW